MEKTWKPHKMGYFLRELPSLANDQLTMQGIGSLGIHLIVFEKHFIYYIMRAYL
jgi:hypothetical protein